MRLLCQLHQYSPIARETNWCKKKGGDEDGEARIKGFHMSSKSCRARAPTRSMSAHVCVWSFTDEARQNVDLYQQLRCSLVTSSLPQSCTGNDFVWRKWQQLWNCKGERTRKQSPEWKEVLGFWENGQGQQNPFHFILSIIEMWFWPMPWFSCSDNSFIFPFQKQHADTIHESHCYSHSQ